MVICLARMFICIELVAFDAAAEVGTLGVGARLGAEAGWVALVNVLACEPVRFQLLATGAKAERTVWSLFTPIRAEAALVLTLGEITASTWNF